jgi:hypothetical protein
VLSVAAAHSGANTGSIGSIHATYPGGAAANAINARDAMLDDAVKKAVQGAARGLIAAASKLTTSAARSAQTLSPHIS